MPGSPPPELDDFISEGTTERRLRDNVTARAAVHRRVPDWPFTLGGAFLLVVLSLENRLVSFGPRFALVIPAWALLAWGISEVVAKNVTEPRPRSRE